MSPKTRPAPRAAAQKGPLPSTETRRFEIPPDPAGTLEGLRSAGYTTSTAVADLIDNALTGGASQIEVHLGRVDDGGRWILEIADNGRGMSCQTLVEAMRLSARPAGPRLEHDLGRYGIGMKAAALHLSGSGQMEIETLMASGDGGHTGWSVEGVREGGWTIEVSPPSRQAHGTTVRIFDPLMAGGEPSQELAQLWQHLSLIFAVQVAHKLHLSVQGKRVMPIDVLGENMDGTRHLGPWFLDDGHVTVRGYVLPAADPEGTVPSWLPSRQELSGLHLRRGGRAITHGGWTGLTRRGRPPNDRVRLLVCIRPEHGDRWGVDLTKSRMTIPPDLLPRLREIADELTSRAQRARGLRTDAGGGQSGQTPVEAGPIWTVKNRIDRHHPVVARALREGGDSVKELLRELERGGR